MKLSLYIFGLLCFWNCKSPIEAQGENTTCDSLYQGLKVNWKLSKQKSYFESTNSFIKELSTKYRECIIGKKQTDIIKLFGAPTETREYKNQRFKYSISYLITPPCSASTNESCANYIFYFNEEFVVINAMEVENLGLMYK